MTSPERTEQVVGQALRAVAGPPPPRIPAPAEGPTPAYRLTAHRLWWWAAGAGLLLGGVAGLARWVL